MHFGVEKALYEVLRSEAVGKIASMGANGQATNLGAHGEALAPLHANPKSRLHRA